MNSAIEFLALSLNATGHNSKSVLLHSIKVGFYLYEMGYSKDIVLAGLLHDILEDTETPINNLHDKFDSNVAKIVSATSFNTSINDKTEQFQDMFNRCLKCGKEALIVKAVDIMDNSSYIHLVTDRKTRDWLLFKMKSFINISKEMIQDEEIWSDLNKKHDSLIKELSY